VYTNASAQTVAGHRMRFNDTKTETLNLRVSPTFKDCLKLAADREQRSMVNMLEVLLADYCERTGIAGGSRKNLPPPARKAARSPRKAQLGAAV